MRGVGAARASGAGIGERDGRALVGVGPVGQQRPVIVVEPWPDRRPESESERTALLGELRALAQAHPHTRPIQDFLIHPALPVDIRHNAKIFREQLAVWAASQLEAAGR